MCYIETKDSSSEPVSMEQGSEPVPEKNDAIEEKVATDQSMKLRYSPAVLKLAQEHNIQLTEVSGTGKNGRITRKDIEKVIETGSESPVDRKSTRLNSSHVA